MSAARSDLCVGTAGQSAPDRDGPRSGQAHGQGGEGAGGLYGRDSAHDRQGLVHHQRYRAGDRQPAAPLARRVFRARQGQDPQLGQAAVFRPHHSLPWLLARLRIRRQGHSVFPRRPPPQDAGHHSAQGPGPESRADPGALLCLRPHAVDGRWRFARIRARPFQGRSGPLRPDRPEWQSGCRQGQAHQHPPSARAGAGRHATPVGAGRLPVGQSAGAQPGVTRHRRDRGPRQ